MGRRGARRRGAVGLPGVLGPYAISTQWAGLRLFGPFYYLPVLVPLVVLGAAGLVTMGRRTTGWLPAGLAVVMTALTGPAIGGRVADQVAVRDDLQAVERFVQEQRLQNAVLLLPRRGDSGFLGTTPFLANDPELRQSVLYAEERGAGDLELARRFPARGLYRLSEDLPPGRTTGGALTLDRLQVQTSESVTARFRLTNPTDAPVVVAYLTDGRRRWTRVLDRESGSGRGYDVSWTMAAPDAAPADPQAVRVTGPGVLTVGLEVRSATDTDTETSTGGTYGTDGTGGTGGRWERRLAVEPVDGGASLQLLRPGEGWAQDAVGGWRSAGRDNPVSEVDLTAGPSRNN